MLAGDFARKLKRLNSNLRIYCGDNNSNPASLYYVNRQSEEVTVCGVDKNIVPKDPVYDSKGHVIKSGWIRVINILINKKLTTKKKAEKIFECNLYATPQPVIEKTYIQNKVEAAEKQGKWNKDDLAEIGEKL